LDIFDSKTVTPMLIGSSQQAFDSTDYIYELKLDGIRCLAYLWDSGMELRNKRNKRLNAIYPELDGINRLVKAKCIIDGELVVLNNGKPDFYEVQRRSLMANPTKIDIAAKQKPVCFTAFDILYADDRQVTQLPLMERKDLLSETVDETPRLAVSRYIDTNGAALYRAAAGQGLEGVVAKKKGSKYYCGKSTKDWIKIKALKDEDFIVCGYFMKAGNMVSVIFGLYDTGRIIYQGHVVMGVSRQDFRVMAGALKADKSYYPAFPDFTDVTWLRPTLVCRVEYMERTAGGGLRQPVFRGLRDDKIPEECVVFRG